jgi:hypothetical protein
MIGPHVPPIYRSFLRKKVIGLTGPRRRPETGRSAPRHGCQAECFHTKNPNKGIFRTALEWKILVYLFFCVIRNIEVPFGTLYDPPMSHFLAEQILGSML